MDITFVFDKQLKKLKEGLDSSKGGGISIIAATSISPEILSLLINNKDGAFGVNFSLGFIDKTNIPPLLHQDWAAEIKKRYIDSFTSFIAGRPSSEVWSWKTVDSPEAPLFDSHVREIDCLIVTAHPNFRGYVEGLVAAAISGIHVIVLEYDRNVAKTVRDFLESSADFPDLFGHAAVIRSNDNDEPIGITNYSTADWKTRSEFDDLDSNNVLEVLAATHRLVDYFL